MKLRVIIPFLILLLFAVEINAQAGGRKREGAIKAKKTFSLKRNRSAGHADKFAKSKGRKGLFVRIFKKKEAPQWVKSPNRQQQKELERE